MGAEQPAEIKHIADPFPVWKSLKYLGLPISARDGILRVMKRFSSPGEVEKRISLAEEISPASPLDADLRRDGWADLNGLMQPEATGLAEYLLADVQARRDAGTLKAHNASTKTQFLISVCKADELIGRQEIADVVLSRRLLDLAARYFGEVPVLSNLQLWWSPPNDSLVSSQLFHSDEEDRSQLKCFLNVTDVDDSSGPLTLVGAQHSEKILAGAGGTHGRFNDNEIARVLDGDKPVALTGPSGSIACIDTSRCLHFGSRCNSKDRVVLMFQFTRFSAPRSRVPIWGAGRDRAAVACDPIQRRALMLR